MGRQQILYQDLAVGPLAPGASVTLPLNLGDPFAAYAPQQVWPDRSTAIRCSAATATSATFINDGTVADSAIFRAQLFHSIETSPPTIGQLLYQGLGASAGSNVTLQQAYNNGAPALAQEIAETALRGPVVFRRDGVGTAQTLGAALRNMTAALNTLQQNSPVLEMEGSAWKADAGGSSRSIKYAMQVKGTQTAGDPFYTLAFYSSYDGAPYADPFFELNQAHLGVGDDIVSLTLRPTGATTGAQIGYHNDGSLGMFLYNRENSRMYFGTNNAHRWEITAGGNFQPFDNGIANDMDNQLDIGKTFPAPSRVKNYYGAGSVVLDNSTFAGGAGADATYNGVQIAGTGTGGNSQAGMTIRNDQATGVLQATVNGSGYASAGGLFASGAFIAARSGLAGGLSILSEAQDVRIYAGGLAAGNLRIQADAGAPVADGQTGMSLMVHTGGAPVLRAVTLAAAVGGQRALQVAA